MAAAAGSGGLTTRRTTTSTAHLLFLLVVLLLATCAVDAQKSGEGKGGNKNNGTEEKATKTIDEEKDKGPILTGDPQLDYIHDPNLPRELNGFDLSMYPFFSRPPKTGHNFTCDGRRDGFYAAIQHNCQVYYNCLFGLRYEFLCPNYTMFDQVNFICHYASEVDCAGSEKHYSRNDDLYVTTTTTTVAPVTPRIIYVDRPRPRRPVKPLRRPVKPFQRPNRRKPQPVYEYYDDQDYASDYYDYYYDDPIPTTTTTTTRRPIRHRRPGHRLGGGGSRGSRPRLGAGTGGRRRRIRTTTSTTTELPAEYDDYYDYYEYDYNPVDQNKPPQTPQQQQRQQQRPQQEQIQNPIPPPASIPAQRRSRPGQFRRPSFRRNHRVIPTAAPIQTLNPVLESGDKLDKPEGETKPEQQSARFRVTRTRNSDKVITTTDELTVNINNQTLAAEEIPDTAPSVSGRRLRLPKSRRVINEVVAIDKTSETVEESVGETLEARTAELGFGERRRRQRI